MAIVKEIEKNKSEGITTNGKVKEKFNIGVAEINIGTGNFNNFANIKPGKGSNIVDTYVSVNKNTFTEKSNDNNSKLSSFDININGSLKLMGDKGQSIDIIDELRKNPNMLTTLTNMIADKMKYLDKGVNVVEKQR